MPPTDSATRTRAARSAPGSSSPAANDRTLSSLGRAGLRGALAAADRGERREPADQAEPDREHLAVASPGVPPELGHRQDGHHGVRDEHDPEGPTTARGGHRQLEPDEHGEADDGRPAPEPLRVGRRRGAGQADPAQRPGAQPVERRERIEPGPGRSDEGRHEGQPDPAVGPQEERGDVALRRTAEDDRADDDPDPGQQADAGQPDAEGRRDPDGPILPEGCRLGRRAAAQDHDGERRGDRQRAAPMR